MKLRAVSSEPPEAPTKVERQILTSYDDGAKDSGSQIRPWWLAKLCRNRRLMRGCILQLKQESGEELFLLLILAIQTPLLACFRKLAVSMLTAAGPSCSMTATAEDSMSSWEHVFSYQGSPYVFSDEPLFAGSPELLVVLGATFLGDDIVVCDGVWEDLSTFLGDLPGDASAQSSASAKRCTSPSVDMLKANPWLGEVFKMDEERATKKATMGTKASDRHSKPQQAHDDDGDDLPEGAGEGDAVTVGMVFDELYRKREEVGVVDLSEGKDFSTHLLGGAWTAANKGSCYDAFQGRAHGGAPSTWCEKYLLCKTMRFSTRLYGDKDACTLAKAWCSRMQLFYCLWQKSGDDNYSFAADADSSWTMPPDFVALFQGGSQAAKDRCHQVLGVKPGKPVK